MTKPDTSSPRTGRSVPSVGDDTGSRWWSVLLLPSVVVAIIFSLVIFLNDSTGVAEYLGNVGGVLLLGLIVIAAFLSLAALYIDADKIQDRDLDWYPRWWLYFVAEAVLAFLLISWTYEGDNGIAAVLLSVNIAMTPVGLWYVFRRIRHAGIS